MTLPRRYGFNPGSQLVLVGLQNSLAVSNCAVTTTLAPAAAGLSSLLVKAIISHRSTGALPLTCLCMPVELPWCQGAGRDCCLPPHHHLGRMLAMGDRRHPNLRPDPIHMTVGNDAGLQWRSGMLGMTAGLYRIM